MGFSLKRFFEELQDLLGAEMSPKKRHKALENLVAEAKKYADECGKL